MIYLRLCLFLTALAALPLEAGAERAIPAPSTARVTIERFDEYLESVAIGRIRFRGPVPFQADPPADFTFVREPDDGAAFQLRHYLFPEVIIQGFFYDNAGQTAFTDETWNRLLTTWGRRLGEPFAFGLEQPVAIERNDGPIVLGHVAATATLFIRHQPSAREFRQRFIIVPVTGTPKVFMMTLAAPADIYPVILPRFESFVRGFSLL